MDFAHLVNVLCFAPIYFILLFLCFSLFLVVWGVKYFRNQENKIAKF